MRYVFLFDGQKHLIRFSSIANHMIYISVYVGFELMKQYFMTTPFIVGEILALEERIYFLLTLTVQTTYMNGNSSNIT